MSKIEKKDKKVKMDALTYIKRVKCLGIFGIVVSILLIGYDIYAYKNWISIVSLIVDVLLFIFSIYFIIKSSKLKKIELLAIEKEKKKSSTKKSKN